MTSISLVYQFDEAKLTESLKIDEKIKKLIITNIQSSQAIELLKNCFINVEPPLMIEFIISDEIDIKQIECDSRQYLNKKHLVSFESELSSGEAWIFWKIENGTFYSIKIDDVTIKNVVEDFLLEAMEKNHAGEFTNIKKGYFIFQNKF